MLTDIKCCHAERRRDTRGTIRPTPTSSHLAFIQRFSYALGTGDSSPDQLRLLAQFLCIIPSHLGQHRAIDLAASAILAARDVRICYSEAKEAAFRLSYMRALHCTRTSISNGSFQGSDEMLTAVAILATIEVSPQASNFGLGEMLMPASSFCEIAWTGFGRMPPLWSACSSLVVRQLDRAIWCTSFCTLAWR